MEVIKSEKGYVHNHAGRIELVNDIRKATAFQTGAANRFIFSQIKKKNRELYSVETLASETEPTPKPSSKIVKPAVKSIKHKDAKTTVSQTNTYNKAITTSEDVSKRLHREFDPVLAELREKLCKLDNEILDYRHYIRDETTVLSGSQGFKAFKVHQDMERERVAVKRELQRITKVVTMGDQLATEAAEFKYESYKPRTPVDFRAKIKGER